MMTAEVDVDGDVNLLQANPQADGSFLVTQSQELVNGQPSQARSGLEKPTLTLGLTQAFIHSRRNS